jgi:outer membrane protein assembly factor BamB
MIFKTRKVRPISATFFFLSCALAYSAEWGAFRGAGDGRAPSVALPRHWSGDSNVAWAVRLPASGQSSPVIWKQRAYLTGVSGDSKENLHAFCYSAKDGKLLWQRDLKASRVKKRAPRMSIAAPTGAVDAKHVYFLFDSGDLFAFSHDGKQKWHADVNQFAGPFVSDHDFGGSVRPTSSGLVIHYGHTGPSAVFSVSKEEGKLQWKHEVAPEGGSWSTPVVATSGEGGELVLFSRSGGVVALQAKTGERLWAFETKWSRSNAIPSVVASLEVVVVPSAERGGTLALSMRNPKEPIWRAKQASNGMTSPLVVGEYLFLVNTIGVVYCLRLRTGEELWQHRLPGSAWASPIAVGDAAYFFTAEGASAILAAAPELQIIAKNDLPLTDPLYAVVPAGDGFLFRTLTQLVRVASVPPGKSTRLAPPPAKLAAPPAR